MEDKFSKYAVREDQEDRFSKYAVREEEGQEEPLDVDTSPLPLPKNRLIPGPAPFLLPPDPTKVAAATQGIVYDKKMPVKESIIQALATNPVEREAFIRSYIDALHPGTPVRPSTVKEGQWEYFDPDTKRWTIADPHASAAVTELPELVLSTTLAAGGAVLGSAIGPEGTVAGGILGGMVGQLAGDYSRQKIGQFYGINETQSDATMIKSALPEALLTGAFDATLLGGYAGARGLKAWWKGRQVFKPHEAQALLDSQARAEKIISEIRRKTGSDLFDPDLAQRAAFNETSMGMKALTARDQLRGNHYVGHDLANRDRNNEYALVDYFDAIVLDQRLATVGSPEEGGMPLRRAISDEKFNSQRNIVNAREQATEQASAMIQGIPDVEDAAAGRGLRGALEKKYTDAIEKTRKAYADYYAKAGYRADTGFTSIKIPWSDDVRRQQALLIKEIEAMPLEYGKEAKKQMLLQWQDPAKLSKADRELLGEFGISDSSKEATIDLYTLDDTLRQLRRSIRSKENNTSKTPPDIIVAKRLEDALEKMRNDYLEKNHPELLEMAINAEKASFDEANTFRHGLTRHLLTKDDAGNYILTDGQVIHRILKNKDKAAAEEIAGILRSDPEAMLEAQNFLFAMYRHAVDPNGGLVPNVKGHRKFMRQYGDTVRQFFTPEQMKKIEELGGFAEVIAESSKKLRALNSVWAKDMKGKLERFSAEGLVEAVNSRRFSIDEVRRLKNIANAYGEPVFKAWRAGVAEDLRRRLFVGDTIDPRKLEALVNNYDQMAKLRILFGPNFHTNMNILNDAMKMIKKMGDNIEAYQKQTLFTDLARFAYAPPLSQRGRLVSFGQNARAKAFHLELYKALSDPKELQKLADRTARTMRRITGATTTGAALGALANQEDFND